MMKSLNGIIGQVRNNISTPVTIIAAISIVGVIALGSSFAWYRMYRERQAMERFVEAIENAYEPARSQNTADAWNEVENAFRAAFDQYKNASLAGYYLVYVSQALLEQGQHEAACQELDRAIDYIPRESDLYYSYALKLALMQIDATDQSIRQAGHNRLEQLARDAYNPMRDMARYYYGLQYFNQQDRDAAYTAWQDLLNQDDDTQSVWAERAHVKLAYHE